ncbi:MAG: hypothetical protein M0R74_00340 [Dehalococcoidia bacterium]|nr:hypothetical protein [Dehalococcoidia bacterium]
MTDDSQDSVLHLQLRRTTNGWHVYGDREGGLVFHDYRDALEAALSVATSHECLLRIETPDGEFIEGWHGDPANQRQWEASAE